jgi:hypothetical protein
MNQSLVVAFVVLSATKLKGIYMKLTIATVESARKLQVHQPR